LDEVSGPEEHFFQAFFHHFFTEVLVFFQDEGLEVFFDFEFVFTQSEDEVIFDRCDIEFFSEGPELEGGIGEVLEVLNHVGPDGVLVDVADTGEVVLVGIDDARAIAISPEVSCSAHGSVVPDGDSGVEVLHGSGQVFFGGGGDDVVVVGHEDEVMEDQVVFFGGFFQGLEDDANGLSLVKPEGSVVGSTDQVIGQDCLEYTPRTSHVMTDATSLPKPETHLTFSL
jgi:hypothetical protein